MTLYEFLVGVTIVAVLFPLPVWAQQSPPIHRIGALMPSFANSPYEVALRDGLRELGYLEGENILIEWRRSAGLKQEPRTLATELAGLKVELIVALNTPLARAALETTTLPVVFLSGDPVATGLAQSLAKPGGNGTGVSTVLTELTAKRLELLHQVAPRARRFVYLMNLSNPVTPPQLEIAQKSARTVGVQLIPFNVQNQKELDAALRSLIKHSGDGFAVTSDVLFYANPAKIAQAVRKARLPAIFPSSEYHDYGVLMSYGVSSKVVGRKMAMYVDKILKGAKPTDLPIEQISTYELVLNLRVARELRLDLPQELLLRADEVFR